MRPTRHTDEQDAGWLEQRMVKCGRKTCRCAKGILHGPYTYLAYEVWDDELDRWQTRRRYVRPEELPRVLARIEKAREIDDCLARIAKEFVATIGQLNHDCMRQLGQGLQMLRACPSDRKETTWASKSDRKGPRRRRRQRQGRGW